MEKIAGWKYASETSRTNRSNPLREGTRKRRRGEPLSPVLGTDDSKEKDYCDHLFKENDLSTPDLGGGTKKSERRGQINIGRSR